VWVQLPPRPPYDLVSIANLVRWGAIAKRIATKIYYDK